MKCNRRFQTDFTACASLFNQPKQEVLFSKFSYAAAYTLTVTVTLYQKVIFI